jgi:very-short-patch-repair endonuclease
MDAIEAFARCARDPYLLVTRQQLAAAGLRSAAVTAAVAASELARVRRRVYARHPLEPWAEHLLSGARVDPAFLRHAAAVLLELGPSTALRGRSAAVVWGLDMLVEPDRLELQVGRNQSRIGLPDVDVRRTAAATQVVGGLLVTQLLPTLRGCAQDRPLGEAVAIIDSALRRRLVTPGRLRGTGSLGRAIRLADPLAGSVLESALRVLLADHGLWPESQYVIRDAGRFVARVDFCFPRDGLIVETDGRRWHDPKDVREFDRRRANSCASLGWRVLRFTWAEVLHDPAYVVATVRAALAGTTG